MSTLTFPAVHSTNLKKLQVVLFFRSLGLKNCDCAGFGVHQAPYRQLNNYPLTTHSSLITANTLSLQEKRGNLQRGQRAAQTHGAGERKKRGEEMEEGGKAVGTPPPTSFCFIHGVAEDKLIVGNID